MSICENNLQNLKHGLQKFNKLIDYFNKQIMKLNMVRNLISSPLTWNLSCINTHENVCSRSTGAMHKKSTCWAAFPLRIDEVAHDAVVSVGSVTVVSLEGLHIFIFKVVVNSVNFALLPLLFIEQSIPKKYSNWPA